MSTPPRAAILDTSLSLLGLLALTGTDGRRDAVRRRLTVMDSSLPPLRDLARFAQRLGTVVLYATLDEAGRPAAAQAVGYDVFADRPRGVAPVDASVFPASLGVNPQWTVMAVADLAAAHVGGD